MFQLAKGDPNNLRHTILIEATRSEEPVFAVGSVDMDAFEYIFRGMDKIIAGAKEYLCKPIHDDFVDGKLAVLMPAYKIICINCNLEARARAHNIADVVDAQTYSENVDSAWYAIMHAHNRLYTCQKFPNGVRTSLCTADEIEPKQGAMRKYIQKEFINQALRLRKDDRGPVYAAFTSFAEDTPIKPLVSDICDLLRTVKPNEQFIDLHLEIVDAVHCDDFERARTIQERIDKYKPSTPHLYIPE